MVRVAPYFAATAPTPYVPTREKAQVLFTVFFRAHTRISYILFKSLLVSGNDLEKKRNLAHSHRFHCYIAKKTYSQFLVTLIGSCTALMCSHREKTSIHFHKRVGSTLVYDLLRRDGCVLFCRNPIVYEYCSFLHAVHKEAHEENAAKRMKKEGRLAKCLIL